MKKLPIYGLLLAGYIVIIIGVVKLYNGLLKVETIDVPAQTYETVTIGILPLIILGLFILIIAVGLGVLLIAYAWKYLLAHKTLLPIPFILIGYGFVQFSGF